MIDTDGPAEIAVLHEHAQLRLVGGRPHGEDRQVHGHPGPQVARLVTVAIRDGARLPHPSR